MLWLLVGCLISAVLSAELKTVPAEKAGIVREELYCSKIRIISENIMKAVEETKNLQYTSGNTRWEHETLRDYEDSLTRLDKITELACTPTEKPSDCFAIIGQYDSDIEDWWKKGRKENKDIFNEIFVDNLKICCEVNKFGPKCENCPSNSDTSACSGQGECEGSGTRNGSGECTCNVGAEGKSCELCREGYFKGSNICQKCSASCLKGCSGPTGKDCDNHDCATGFLYSLEKGCEDVDECTEEGKCTGNTFCQNFAGSFSCVDCDVSCNGCDGHGASKCKACAESYELVNGTCTNPNAAAKEEEKPEDDDAIKLNVGADGGDVKVDMGDILKKKIEKKKDSDNEKDSKKKKDYKKKRSKKQKKDKKRPKKEREEL